MVTQLQSQIKTAHDQVSLRDKEIQRLSVKGSADGATLHEAHQQITVCEPNDTFFFIY